MTDGIFPLLLFAVQQNWILYSFFWVIPGRLNFICRRFGTSETSANKIQSLGIIQKKNITFTSRRKFEIKKNSKCWRSPNMKLHKNSHSESGTVTYKQMEEYAERNIWRIC
jgi:hypothetical protein